MVKIALITPMLQPYRLTFYEKLDKSIPDAKWIIFHGVKKTEDGRPAYFGRTSFSNIGLREYIFRIGPFTLLIHRGLMRQVKNFNPDIIIIQAITGNLSYWRIVTWAAKKNKKILNWACGWEPGRAKGIFLGFKNLLVSAFFKKGNAFLSYSTKAFDYIVQRGIDPDKIVVCYNGIEIDHILKMENEIMEESKDVRDKLQFGESIVFLFVGGLIEDKKVDLLLNAFSALAKKYKDIRLLIIGDGPLRQSILAKIDLINDKRVIYMGRIVDGVDSYIAASTCLVLPGAGGLALNQAMFWRKICIAGVADGTEEDLVLDGHTGFRFEKDNLSDLTNSMEKVINCDKSQLREMGDKAREIIINKSNVNNMVEIFTGKILHYYPELRNEFN